jgi:hypothetical protein
MEVYLPFAKIYNIFSYKDNIAHNKKNIKGHKIRNILKDVGGVYPVYLALQKYVSTAKQYNANTNK